MRPGTIILACGDGNAQLTHLTWTSWTPSGAAGYGYFTHNTCTPNCAEGTFVSSPTNVRLAYPIRTSAGEEFAIASYIYPSTTAPGGYTTFTGRIATSPG